MVRRSNNAWETQDKAGLIPISPSRSLFLSTSGPARSKQTEPVLIFFTGGGTPVAMYVRLQRLLSRFIRVYFYDRAGYDQSDPTPVKRPAATDIVADLVLLLQAVHVGPPYILCGYSWGALMARTFLDLYPDDVFGLVLADPGTELMYELLKPVFPPAGMEAMLKGVDWTVISNLQEESELTDEEWNRMLDALEKSEAASSKEDPRASGRALAQKRQNVNMPMGKDNIVSVLQGDWAAQWQLVYDEGVKLGNGSEMEREEARRSIELFRNHHKGLCYGQVSAYSEGYPSSLEYCRLTFWKSVGISAKVYGAYAPGMYHDLVIRKPELVVQAVRVVLDGPKDSMTDVKGTNQMATLPAYEIKRTTAVDFRINDAREARLAKVLLHI